MLLHCVICTGKPSRCSDDPDFIPTIFEYTKRTEVQDQQKVARYHRLQKRLSSWRSRWYPWSTSIGRRGGYSRCSNGWCGNLYTDAILKIDKATSTGPELNNGNTSETQEYLRQTCEALEEQTVALKKELLMATSPSAKLKGDDKQTHFYTGLPSYAVFSSLLSLLSTVVSTQCTTSSLSLSEQFLLFMYVCMYM